MHLSNKIFVGLILFSIISCAKSTLMHVKDNQGNPIAGATIGPQPIKFFDGGNQTNSSGRIRVYELEQGLSYLVVKPGYEDASFKFSEIMHDPVIYMKERK